MEPIDKHFGEAGGLDHAEIDEPRTRRQPSGATEFRNVHLVLDGEAAIPPSPLNQVPVPARDHHLDTDAALVRPTGEAGRHGLLVARENALAFKVRHRLAEGEAVTVRTIHGREPRRTMGKPASAPVIEMGEAKALLHDGEEGVDIGEMVEDHKVVPVHVGRSINHTSRWRSAGAWRRVV